MQRTGHALFYFTIEMVGTQEIQEIFSSNVCPATLLYKLCTKIFPSLFIKYKV